MDEVGIAYIFQKKEINIDGVNKVYYEVVDVAVGFCYNFGDNGKKFVLLEKNKLGQSFYCGFNPESEFVVSDFLTFRKLSKNNNYLFDIDLFVERYRKNVGVFCYRDDDRFLTITDSRFLECIKKKRKDYDESILNNNTDISQMYNSIKKTIVSQDEQIMQILTSLFKNQKVVNSTFDIDMIAKLKENIIVYGSTGTGKTEILKRIAKIYNVPIVIEDATSFSEIGYVGRNITDMLEDLYLASGKNISLAEKGILVIDEFDKLAEKKEGTNDHVSREGVQRSLLKLLDGSNFYLGDREFNTSKLSVVALGAFTDIVDGDDYSNVSSTDFEKYGIKRELLGRFSKFVAMNCLSKDDIKKILVESDFSPLNTYKILFESMNIKFSYEDSFLDYIAERAIELNSGARSLKTVFDEIINSALFKIFAGEYSSIHLTAPSDEKKTYVLIKSK